MNEELKETIRRLVEAADKALIRWPATWARDEEDGGRQKKAKECFIILSSCPKLANGKWNEEGALAQLLVKFGQNEPAVKTEGAVSQTSSSSASSATQKVKAEVKEPKDMDIKELKKVLKKIGLEKETKAAVEKKELEELLATHRAEHGTGKETEKKPGKKREVPAGEGSDDADGESPSKKAKKVDQVAVEGNRKAAEALRELSGLYYQAGENMKGGVYSKAAKAVRECEELLINAKAIVKMKIKGVGKGTAGICEEIHEKGFCEKLEKMRAGEE